MKNMNRSGVALLSVLSLLLLLYSPLYSEQTPVTNNHLLDIDDLFSRNNVSAGYVALDRYGRVELKGEYLDEKEVDRAFSLAQTVVGIRWVSPVTPENIKVKEWEKRLSNIFSRANVLKPSVSGDDNPGPIRNRYALVVGVGQFKYGVNPLQYAVRDANGFYNFLIDPKRGGFSRENVFYLADQNATKDNIAKALDKIRNMAEADDLVSIYMSSHGTPPDKYGGVYIVTYDTEVKPRERVWHTALSESMLKDFVSNIRAKRLVMILDTCYSNGAYSKVPGFLPPGGKSLGSDDDEGYGISREHANRLLGAKDITMDEAPPQKTGAKNPNSPKNEGWGKVLISASGAGEKSWESDQLHNSIFTYYYLDGLGRYNGSVKDAFFYAKPLVSQRVKQEKGRDIEQTPNVFATNNNWDMRMLSSR